MAINSSGEPLVAYRDQDNSFKATVMKYSGGAWAAVGTAGFSAGVASYVSLAINSSGEPFVAFADGSNSNKATVMKYSGGAWKTIGTAGFSYGVVSSLSLKLDKSDNPYVAVSDDAKGSQAFVWRYNGTAWTEIQNGIACSYQGTNYVSLAFNQLGQLYIAYQDAPPVDYKASVVQFACLDLNSGISEPPVSKNPAALNLYPNPTTGLVTLTNILPQSKIVLYNATGQLISTQQVNENTCNFDLSNLPHGIYFVQVSDANGVKLGKIIKE